MMAWQVGLSDRTLAASAQTVKVQVQHLGVPGQVCQARRLKFSRQHHCQMVSSERTLPVSAQTVKGQVQHLDAAQAVPLLD